MGIIEKDGREFQPICDDCGIALCWSISEREYLIIKEWEDEGVVVLKNYDDVVPMPESLKKRRL